MCFGKTVKCSRCGNERVAFIFDLDLEVAAGICCQWHQPGHEVLGPHIVAKCCAYCEWDVDGYLEVEVDQEEENSADGSDDEEDEGGEEEEEGLVESGSVELVEIEVEVRHEKIRRMRVCNTDGRPNCGPESEQDFSEEESMSLDSENENFQAESRIEKEGEGLDSETFCTEHHHNTYMGWLMIKGASWYYGVEKSIKSFREFDKGYFYDISIFKSEEEINCIIHAYRTYLEETYPGSIEEAAFERLASKVLETPLVFEYREPRKGLALIPEYYVLMHFKDHVAVMMQIARSDDAGTSKPNIVLWHQQAYGFYLSYHR